MTKLNHINPMTISVVKDGCPNSAYPCIVGQEDTPIKSSEQFYRKEDADRYIDELERLVILLEGKYRWREYPEEKPTRTDRYLVEYLNPNEGDAYILMECDYLIDENWSGWCTEHKVVRWFKLPQ